MGSLADANSTVESVLDDDELEEGEIREEVEEENMVHLQNSPYLDDLEEGEMREETCPQFDSAYINDLEVGEIREETDPQFAAIRWDYEPMMVQHLTKVMELPPSKEKIVRENVCLKLIGKECLENHVKNEATVLHFDEESELGETDHIEEGAKGPGESSLTRQVEEVYSKRFTELLSLQDLELKKFKILKSLHEMEFKVNCSGKLSIQDFETLDKKFKKHMNAQRRTFIAMQIKARNRDQLLKEKWLEEAREGTLEGSFCEEPLPVLGFKMEKFDCESEMEDLVAKNACSLSHDMHLDAVVVEGSSDYEALLEAPGDFDHMIAEVSHCNDKTPYVVTPSSDFESEEMTKERNERRFNEKTVGIPEKLVQNLTLSLSPNSPRAIMADSNLECDEVTIEEHELACTETVLLGMAETNMQANINSNSPLQMVHSDRIVVSDSASHDSTIPQENQVNPATNLPCTGNTTTTTSLSVSTERNIIAETPQVNQNEASVEQLATQIHVDIVAQVLQMMQHDLGTDPLQNELNALRKLKTMLTEGHSKKKTSLRAEFEKELDNTRRKYHQMEVELDAQWSYKRAHLNKLCQKLCMHQSLAEEFEHMRYWSNFIDQLPHGQEKILPSSHLQFNPNPILRPVTPSGTQLPSTANHGLVPTPYTSNHGLVPTPYTMPQSIQPHATFAVAPFVQRPFLLMQNPQHFVNHQAVLHSSMNHSPIGEPGLGGVYFPVDQQLNQLRAPSLSVPRVNVNYQAVLHLSTDRAPIGRPGLGSVCFPGDQQRNQLRAPSLSVPSVQQHALTSGPGLGSVCLPGGHN